MGLVTPTPFGPLVSSIPFEITPRGASDYGLTGTLTDISRLTSPPFPADLQVATLAFVLTGTTNNYVRNPTSCVAGTATGQAIGYDDPTVVDGPPYTFTPTGCETVAFTPTVSMQIGDRGTTKQNGYPPFVQTIKQPAGSADLRTTKITLPTVMNTNNSAYKLCTEAEAAADACPANSKFGNAVAISPFLAEQLQGPVYLLSQPGRSLPGLLLDLQGRAHVKIRTTTSLVNNTQIQSLATDSPQLPVSELRIALNGGKTTGVFTNRKDLCFKNGSSSEFRTVNAVSKLEGWNGKNTGDVKFAASILGCGPGVSARLTGATGSRPSLRVNVTKHTNAPNVKELELTLSDNLRLVKSRLSERATGTAAVDLGGTSFSYVSSKKLKVSGLPATGEWKGHDQAEQGRRPGQRPLAGPARARPEPHVQGEGEADAGDGLSDVDPDELQGEGPLALPATFDQNRDVLALVADAGLEHEPCSIWCWTWISSRAASSSASFFL